MLNHISHKHRESWICCVDINKREISGIGIRMTSLKSYLQLSGVILLTKIACLTTISG